MFRYFWLAIVFFVTMSGLTIEASLEKAILLKAHGLNDDAKRELINLIFHDDSERKDKSRAYYLLGAIAFDENRIQSAIRTWDYIIEEYPNSDEALMVKERMDELSKVTLAVYTESIESEDYSVAKLYLKNAEFWSEDKDDRWMIDSSWIPKVAFALKWYDKIISEFPKSEVARIAYIGKIRTLLSRTEFKDRSWDEARHAAFSSYIEQVIDTFRNFEKDFPNDSTLQACRFQIGQAYFVYEKLAYETRDLVKAREWFDKVIVNSGENDTFYRQISEERNNQILTELNE